VGKEKEQQLRATEKAEMRTKEQVDQVGVCMGIYIGMYMCILKTPSTHTHTQVAELERASAALVQEVHDQKEEIVHLRKAIFQLEKDRERLGRFMVCV
jgi:hypothetical protein